MLGMYYMLDDVLIPSSPYRFRLYTIITFPHVLSPIRLTAVLYIWEEGYFVYIYVYVYVWRIKCTLYTI